jgi:D-mannonate dehydratase
MGACISKKEKKVEDDGGNTKHSTGYNTKRFGKHFRVNFKHFRDDDKFKKNNFFEEGNKNGVEEIEIKKSFD